MEFALLIIFFIIIVVIVGFSSDGSSQEILNEIPIEIKEDREAQWNLLIQQTEMSKSQLDDIVQIEPKDYDIAYSDIPIGVQLATIEEAYVVEKDYKIIELKLKVDGYDGYVYDHIDNNYGVVGESFDRNIYIKFTNFIESLGINFFGELLLEDFASIIRKSRIGIDIYDFEIQGDKKFLRFNYDSEMYYSMKSLLNIPSVTLNQKQKEEIYKREREVRFRYMQDRYREDLRRETKIYDWEEAEVKWAINQEKKMKDHILDLPSYVIKLIGDNKEVEKLPELCEMMQNGDYNQKRLSASSVKKIATTYGKECKVAIPYLFDLLHEEKGQIRQYSLLAIFEIVKHTVLNEEQIITLEYIYSNDEKDYNREAALRILDYLKKY